jgi:hypothetical protein
MCNLLVEQAISSIRILQELGTWLLAQLTKKILVLQKTRFEEQTTVLWQPHRFVARFP